MMMSGFARRSLDTCKTALAVRRWKEMRAMIADYVTMTFDQIPRGTAQMKRVNHRTGVYFKSKRLQETEDIYLNALFPHRPAKPIEGPVSVSIDFSYSIKNKKQRGRWKTSKPDLDNVAKLLIDCMTKTGFWLDDSQVVMLKITKAYALGELAEITIRYTEVFDD